MEEFDPETLSLLCLENNSTCFDDFECSDGSSSCDHKNLNFNYQCSSIDNYGLDSFVGFGIQSDQTFLILVEKERYHLPKHDYLKRLRSGELELSVRNEALDWILKAHAHYGFGPCSFFLSVNYLDRFLSVYELPASGKAWSVQLLAVACLSIAAKMEESEVPLSVDLQVGEPKFVFEAKAIQRTELTVLSTLNWKMQALTTFSFIDYFLRKITCDQNSTKSLISRSVKLIINITRYIEFLEFRASEIAAAVAVSVSRELLAKDTIDEVVACFATDEKERILKCIEVMGNLSLIQVSANFGSNLVAFAPQSPDVVLHASCLSYKTEESTVGSYTNASHDNPNTKRIKPNAPTDGI